MTFFRRAYSTTCRSTSQLAVGSPPWNSMVSARAVVWKAKSTARSATSIDMSVSVRSMPTIELWQYWQPWLQRWVSTKACSVGPWNRYCFLRRQRSAWA